MFQIKASRHLKIQGQLPAPPSAHPHLRMNYKICAAMEAYLNSLAPSWSFDDDHSFRVVDRDGGFFRSLDWLRAHAENCRILTLTLHWEGEGPFWLCLTTYHGQVLILDLNKLPRLPDETIPEELSTVLKDFMLVGEDIEQVLEELGLEGQPFLERDAIDMLNFEHPNFPYCLGDNETSDRGYLTALMFDFYPGPLGEMAEEDRPLGLRNAVKWDMLYPLGAPLTTLKKAYLRMVGLAGFYSIGLFCLLVFSGGQLLTPREAVISMLINQASSRLVRMIFSKRTVRKTHCHSRAGPPIRKFSVTTEGGDICTVQTSSSCTPCSYRSAVMSGEDGGDVLDLGPGSPFDDLAEAGPKPESEKGAESESEAERSEAEDEAVLLGAVNETPPREPEEPTNDSESESEGSEDSWVEGLEVEPLSGNQTDPETGEARVEEDSGADDVANAGTDGKAATVAVCPAGNKVLDEPEVDGAAADERVVTVQETFERETAESAGGNQAAGEGNPRSGPLSHGARGQRPYSWNSLRASGTVPQHLTEAGIVGNQWRGLITREDPYDERRRPEGVFGPQRRPRDSLARPDHSAELPVRYRCPGTWGRACSFCGATSHLSRTCGGRLGMVSRHGASCRRWPETCLYPYCFDKQGHKTAACPALHAFCRRCRRRGHLPGTCEQMPSVGEEILSENYVLYCNYGRYTRNYFNRFELDWSYLGPSVDEEDLVEVGVGSHRAMVGWDGEKLDEFALATDAQKHSMITREVFR